MTERWTVGKLAVSAAEVLRKKGFESDRLEADLLLAEVMGLARLELYTRFDMPVDDEQRARYRDLLKRRLAHEPMAYILGRRDFMDWTVAVRSGVLIPRPESEHLVEAALAGLPDDRDLRLVEVGVGSGCLILSLLKERARARGLGLDIEAVPLEVSRENAAALGLEDRFEALRSDRFQALAGRADWREGLDLVISNPPYIRPDESVDLAPDVRDFEPAAALFYPGDGIDFHRALLVEGAPMLAPGGFFVLELPGEGGEALRAFTAECLPGFRTAVIRDFGGRERVFLAGAGDWNSVLDRHLTANSAS